MSIDGVWTSRTGIITLKGLVFLHYGDEEK